MRRRTLMKQLASAMGILFCLELGVRVCLEPPTVDRYRLYRIHGADGFEMLDQMGMSARLLEHSNRLLTLDEAWLWRGRPELDMDARALSLVGGTPWHIRTNADGFRDADTGDGSWVALGDSCTFGWGVDDNWTEKLEVLTGRSIRNLAIPGYSAVQGRRVFDAQMPSKPSVLFLNFGANDGHMVFEGDRERLRQRKTVVGRARRAVASLHMVRHARFLAYPIWAKTTVLAWRSGAYRPRVTADELAEEYEAMIEQAGRTVLLDICARDEYGQVMALLADSDERVSMVRYRELGEDTVDGCHPTEAGHAALAAAVSRVLSAGEAR